MRVTGATLLSVGGNGILQFPLPKLLPRLALMLVPFLREPVRLKGRLEIFLVVASNWTARAADLIRPGTDVIERGVPWSMLEAARTAPLNLRLSA